MEQFKSSQFLLNLAGCRNILLNRNFAAEIVGRMQEATFFSRIAIRNASDHIQVFNEMFVSRNVRSCVTIEISGPGVCNFKF